MYLLSVDRMTIGRRAAAAAVHVTIAGTTVNDSRTTAGRGASRALTTRPSSRTARVLSAGATEVAAGVAAADEADTGEADAEAGEVAAVTRATEASSRRVPVMPTMPRYAESVSVKWRISIVTCVQQCQGTRRVLV